LYIYLSFELTLNIVNFKLNHIFKMNKEPENKIPSFVIYQEPTMLYQKFMNRVCQSKTKMTPGISKELAISIANNLWEKQKDYKAKVEEYVQSLPTNPIKKDMTQKSLNLFFSKKNMKDENLQNINEDASMNQISEKKRKHSALDPIDQPKETNSLKKNKLSAHHYNLTQIVDFLFQKKMDITPDIKADIQKDLLNDVGLNENMYISLTEYIKLKNDYDKLSTFTKKENETSKNIEKLENALNDYSQSLLDLRLIKLSLKDHLTNSELSHLANRNLLQEYEQNIADNKVQNSQQMIIISSLISIILPTLEKRIRNARYYKKSSLAPEIYDSPLQFLCFNLDKSWDFSQKLMSLLINEDSNIYPLELSDLSNILNLFKDKDLLAMKLDTLYSLLFSQDKETNLRAKGSKMQALKTIIVKIFPIMTFRIQNTSYLLDVTKMQENNDMMLNLLVEILEVTDSDIKKSKFLLIFWFNVLKIRIMSMK